MLSKSARVADTTPNAMTGVYTVSKDVSPDAAPRNRGDYRAMGQGDLHPNELYD